MNDEPKVWIAKSKLKNGKTSYRLRWICPHSHDWESRPVGTDNKRAIEEKALLSRELRQGTYTHLRRVSWDEFVAEHLRLISGIASRREARRALHQFGEICGPTRLDRVVFGMFETFVARLRLNGDSTATQNKKLRYLHIAFGKAVQRSYVVKNPLHGWRFAKEDQKSPRIVTDDEESRLLKAAKEMYGYQWWAFIFVALRVGARREELRTLRWREVDFDQSRVLFTKTKGRKDRYVPLNDDVLTVLRRLQAMTIRDGGPFVGIGVNPHPQWDRIRKAAGVTDVTIHDLRRTFVTRLVRAGVPLPSVQKLAGHANIATTMRYYNWVSDDDLRAGIARLAAGVVG